MLFSFPLYSPFIFFKVMLVFATQVELVDAKLKENVVVIGALCLG